MRLFKRPRTNKVVFTGQEVLEALGRTYPRRFAAAGFVSGGDIYLTATRDGIFTIEQKA